MASMSRPRGVRTGDRVAGYLPNGCEAIVVEYEVLAPLTDPDLKNAWGLTSGPTSPWWVSDNGTNKSTLYNAAGVKQGLIVSVPWALIDMIRYTQIGAGASGGCWAGWRW